jgi:hypothetical protein
VITVLVLYPNKKNYKSKIKRKQIYKKVFFFFNILNNYLTLDLNSNIDEKEQFINGN